MITRCNQCGTKFEISAELLQSEDTSVRCGECLSVFDARAELVSGDSADNYRSVSTSRQSSTRTAVARQQAFTAPVAERSTEMADTTAADQYAYISDDDLENAATVILDQTNTDGNIPVSQPQPASVGDRPGDAFYSPDLHVEPTQARRFEDAVTENSASNLTSKPSSNAVGNPAGNPAGKRVRAAAKIDPSISLDESLDNISYEFERTMALGDYSEGDAQGTINDQNQGIAGDADSFRDSRLDSASAFQAPGNSPVTNRINSQGDQTRRLADVGVTPDVWQSDQELQPERAMRPVAGPLADPVVTADRNYAPITDEVLVEEPAFEPPAMDPDRHLSIEERGVQPGFDTAESSDRHEIFQEPAENQDSASELRRYVNSRGGAIVSGSDTEPGEKTPQSSSMLKPLLLVCLLAAAALYIARDTIATMNLPGPVLSAFCSVTGCELPLQKDVQQLELIRHRMSSHKKLDNILVFSVDLINRARFPQPYPVLVVTMANNEGQSVAFRKFQPDDYLEEDPALKRLPAGKPVRIRFEIVDPGPEALSTELSFE